MGPTVQVWMPSLEWGPRPCLWGTPDLQYGCGSWHQETPTRFDLPRRSSYMVDFEQYIREQTSQLFQGSNHILTWLGCVPSGSSHLLNHTLNTTSQLPMFASCCVRQRHRGLLDRGQIWRSLAVGAAANSALPPNGRACLRVQFVLRVRGGHATKDEEEKLDWMNR